MATSLSAPDQEVTIGRATFLSPHDEALVEAGKAMLLGSLEVGREFCKFMVGTATGAVPVYLSLVRWFLPDQAGLSRWDKIFALSPIVVFMLAAGIFVWGYMPTQGVISIDLLASVGQQRDEAIRRRTLAITWGFACFAIGVVGGAIVTIYIIPNLPATAAA